MHLAPHDQHMFTGMENGAQTYSTNRLRKQSPGDLKLSEHAVFGYTWIPLICYASSVGTGPAAHVVKEKS
jgi:hypothetical protein